MNYPKELEVMPEAIEVLFGIEQMSGVPTMACNLKVLELNANLKGQITQAKETLKEISRQIEFLKGQIIYGYDSISQTVLHNNQENNKNKIKELNQRKKQYEVSIKFLEEQIK